VSVQKQLISQLSVTLAEKVITINERGLTSVDWTVYNNGTKRTRFSSVPTSDITAETVVADGFVLSQKDTAGITTTATRSYTAGGMVFTQTNGRGNTTTTVTDIAGRTLSETDAAGNVTSTAYDTAHDLPSCITDAQGHTTCYRYDMRGRKVAEWGTAIQPACFGYDDADNLTSLTTFRGTPETNADGSPGQSGEVTADGDVTQPIQWSSEYNDTELALVYYNYRHYNPADGRWIGRDRAHTNKKCLVYAFSLNNAITWWDYIGNQVSIIGTKESSNNDLDEPKVWKDQININSEGDAVRNDKQWLDTRLPKTVKMVITEIKASIEKRVQALCCTRETSIPNEELAKIKYGINNSVIKKAGDEEYSAYEEYLQIGRFSFYVKDVKIEWNNDAYSWTAIAYAEEQTGTTPPNAPGANALDYVLAMIPFIGKSRKLVIAEYEIANQARCKIINKK